MAKGGARTVAACVVVQGHAPKTAYSSVIHDQALGTLGGRGSQSRSQRSGTNDPQ